MTILATVFIQFYTLIKHVNLVNDFIVLQYKTVFIAIWQEKIIYACESLRQNTEMSFFASENLSFTWKVTLN